MAAHRPSPSLRTSPLWWACRAVALLAWLMVQQGSIWAQVAPEKKEFATRPATRELLDRMRQGGLVLYLRHATSDTDIPDQPRLDPNRCETQRPLTVEGRKLAARLGHHIQAAHIPIGDIHAGPLCRTRETAMLAFGRMQVDPLLMYTAHLTSVQKKPIIDNTRRLLSTPVAPGSNRVVVAHAPNLADLLGYFVKPEGTMVVFAPLGQGRFEYLASITPDDWAALLR